MSRKRSAAPKNHKWVFNEDIIDYLVECESANKLIEDKVVHDPNIVVYLLAACLKASNQEIRHQIIQKIQFYAQSELITDEWKSIVSLVLSILNDIQQSLKNNANLMETKIQQILALENLDLEKITNGRNNLKQRYFKINHMSSIVDKPYDYKSFYHYSHEFREKQHFNVCQTFLDHRRAKFEKYTHRSKSESIHLRQQGLNNMASELIKPAVKPSFDLPIKPRMNTKLNSNQKKTVLLDLDADLFSKKKPSAKSKAASKNKTTPTKNVSNYPESPMHADNTTTATHFNVNVKNPQLINSMNNRNLTNVNQSQMNANMQQPIKNDSKFNIPIIRVNPNLLSKLNMTHINNSRRMASNKPITTATSNITNVTNVTNPTRQLPKLNTIPALQTSKPSSANQPNVPATSTSSSNPAADKNRQENAKEFLTILNSAPNNIKMLVASFLKGNRDLPPEAKGNPLFQVKLTESLITRQIDKNQPPVSVIMEEWVQMDYSSGLLKRVQIPRKIT